jgi:hypothetical protein
MLTVFDHVDAIEQPTEVREESKSGSLASVLRLWSVKDIWTHGITVSTLATLS